MTWRLTAHCGILAARDVHWSWAWTAVRRAIAMMATDFILMALEMMRIERVAFILFDEAENV